MVKRLVIRRGNSHCLAVDLQRQWVFVSLAVNAAQLQVILQIVRSHTDGLAEQEYGLVKLPGFAFQPAKQQLNEADEDLLEFTLPRYQREGKSYLTIAIGCTGGRHRSVAIVEELRRLLLDKRHGGRQKRLQRFRRTGRAVSLSPDLPPAALQEWRTQAPEDPAEVTASGSPSRSTGRRWFDGILLAIEILLNACGDAFVVVGSYWNQPDGQVMLFFILAMSASEVAVGLGLVVQIYRKYNTLDTSSLNRLRG